MRAATAAAVLTLVTSVAGHGYMWSPVSRTRQGFEVCISLSIPLSEHTRTKSN